MFSNPLGNTRTVLALSVISGLMLAMTFTVNIGTIQSASAAAGELVTDFNGDGYEDLVIGVPDEGLNNNLIASGGMVNIMHGSSGGISAVPVAGTGLADQTWNQNSPDVNGVAVDDEDFGYVVAAANFNGDQYSDLAIAQPNGLGEVNIIYGSDNGLSPSGAPVADQIFSQSSPNVEGTSTSQERFAASLAVGDFNDDGYDDLAVGNPGKDISTNAGTQFDAGAVNVLYGSSQGISAVVVGDSTGRADQLWSQNTFGVEEISETLDFFGFALTAGDFNDDGYEDLAIGVPGEAPFGSIEAAAKIGAVNIIYGSSDALSVLGIPDQIYHAGFAYDGIMVFENSFGSSLASGDFNNDGFDDLAAGSPTADVAACPSCSLVEGGAADVIYGSNSGLSSTEQLPAQQWHQGVDGVQGEPESGDLFGTTLTTGDFNNDGRDELVVGVPHDKGILSANPNGGGAEVFWGSPSGVTSSTQLFSQNENHVADDSEQADSFGQGLAAGDYNGDGYDDLAIGVPLEDVSNNSVEDGGAVNIIYGSSVGLTPDGYDDGTGQFDQLWTQNSSNVNDSAEENDRFGWSLG